MAKIESDINTSLNQLYYCKIFIGEIEIVPENILSLTIREWVTGVVPRLSLNLNDDGMLSEIFTLDDNAEIMVEIAKNADDTPIKFDFVLQDYKFGLMGNNQSSVMEISGLLNAPDLFKVLNRSFSNMSSKDVISQIADECGLTFVTPTGFSTSDNMTWLQCGISNYAMIVHVMERSFKSNDAVFCYCDVYKNLNMTSLNTELDKDAINARYDITNYTKDKFENTEDENTIWFNYYDYCNLSGFYNKTNNYGVEYTYYNLEEMISEAITQDISLLAEKTFKDSDYINIVNNYNSILQNNVYDDYTKAMIQNDYFKKNFFCFNMTININPLGNVKLFDVLNVLIPSMPNYVGNEINDIHSGKYAIGGIVYSVGRNNIFQKQCVLFRDGMNDAKFTKKKSNNK